MGSGRKAKEVRRRAAIVPAPSVVHDRPDICQCPRSIGPHVETESCRRMKSKFLEWMKGKMA